jgi:hypothetical protein
MSIQDTHGESVVDLLHRQRREAKQLSAEMEPLMVPYGPGETPSDGIQFCGIPVRVIPMWENHGSAA